VEKLKAIAARKNVTPAQLALAFVLAQGPDIVAIPGAERRVDLEENLGAVDVRLSSDDLAALNAAIPPGSVRGERYQADQMKALNR
jgi:aryl-alcohol dehydrogenase-like predicted oxidoreductase